MTDYWGPKLIDIRRLLGLSGMALVLASCTFRGDDLPPSQLSGSNALPTQSGLPALLLPSVGSSVAGSAPTQRPIVVAGTAAEAPLRRAYSSTASAESGAYTLNFDNVEIKDVLKAVLGDMLQQSYTVDPGIQGTVTIHTAHPLPLSGVLPAFEEALKLSGIALIARDGRYDVIPLQDAAHRGALQNLRSNKGSAGFQIEVLPLKFVPAAEMQRVLEPITQPGTIVRVDSARNTIVLAGTESELSSLVETVSTFDVDWLKTQSFGLFPLQNGSAKAIMADLNQMIGSQTPLASMVRVISIDHLNAILVVSPQLRYVNEVQEWIARFDRGGSRKDPRLYVYHIQNGKAADLASVLSKTLGEKGSGSNDPNSAPDGDSSLAGTNTTGSANARAAAAGQVQLSGLADSASLTSNTHNDFRVTADETNNALLILATPERYATIESALQQLDTVPLQVLLEASVAEVTLTNELKYGLQYFFKNGTTSVLSSGVAPTAIDVSPSGGLSVAFTNGASVRAVLDLLSSITKIKVISSPELMVLNNHTASLQVGDQVPVPTSSAVSVSTPGAPVVNTIELRDTGVILRVTPRVNSGGLVLMDVNQEVSASVPTTSSAIDSPTIQQRRVSSSIAVQDGQTIALGGLISDSRNSSKNGIPYLNELPIVGPLFGTTDDTVTRTELLILITPHVVRDQQSAREVSDELRAKLPLMHQFDPH